MPNPGATIEFIANAEKFDAGNAHVRAEVQKTAAAMSKVAEQAAHASGGGGLEQALGKHGSIKETLESLEGKGNIIALGLIARIAGEIGDKIGEWADKLESGEAASEDIGRELVRSLPILSGLERFAEGLARALFSIGQDLSKQIEAQAAIGVRTKQALQDAQAHSDEERERLKIQREYLATLGEIAEAERKASGGNNENRVAAVAAANQQRAQAERAMLLNLQALAEKARQPIRDLIEEERKRAAALALSKDELVLMEAAQRGASESELIEIREIQDHIGWLERKKDARDKAAESAKQVDAILEKLREESALLGLTAEQQVAVTLGRLGASDAAIREAQGYERAKAALAAYNEEQSFAKSLFESVMTPQERYEEQIRKINQALKDGLITQETANRGAKQAADALDKALKGTIVKATGGAVFEDLTSSLNRIASAAASPDNPLADGISNVADAQREGNGIATETLRAITDGNDKTVRAILKQRARFGK